MQLLAMATLELVVGLGPAAWVVAVLHLVVLYAVLLRALETSGLPRFGWANTVTLVRALLGGLVLAQSVALLTRTLGDSTLRDSTLGDSAVLSTGPATTWPAGYALPVMVGMAVIAVALDGVDGQVARRTDSCTELGARFDVEADAFLVLVLAAHLSLTLGWWVLTIGAVRYLFVLAAVVAPWLGGSLPERTDRKVIGLLQMVVLLLAATGVLTRPTAGLLVAGSLALLLFSFGRDTCWLWRHRAEVSSSDPARAKR